MEFKNYKPIDGKLLKISSVLEDGKIKLFKLRGDFFIHPEESIEQIENYLIGKDIDKDFVSNFEDFLSESQIQVYGFKPQDLLDYFTN